MNIEFKPLPHSPGVLNGTIPVKPGVRVSVSHGRHDTHTGYVGSVGKYQCAIQVNDAKSNPYWDLVMLQNGNTVQDDCSEADIKRLVEFARTVELVENVWVFDTPSNAPKQWCFRFTITNAKGDRDSKLYWANQVWKKDGHRTLSLGIIP